MSSIASALLYFYLPSMGPAGWLCMGKEVMSVVVLLRCLRSHMKPCLAAVKNGLTADWMDD